MGHIIFSPNSVIPVFVIMGIDLHLGKKKALTGDLVSQATSLVLYTALPARLFLSVSRSNFSECLDIRFAACLLICTCVSFTMAWTLYALLVKDRTAVGVVVHSVFRGNFVYLGPPICQSVLGRESMPPTIMMVTFVLSSHNVLATIVLSYYDPLDWKVSWEKMLKGILINPMIVTIFAALSFSLMHIGFPSAADEALSYLRQLLVPMAFTLIGAGTRPSASAGRGAQIMSGAIYKVVVTPLLFTVSMLWLGFSPEQMATAFVMFAAPSTMNVYIVTEKMEGDGELGIVVITVPMLLSAVTLSAGI